MDNSSITDELLAVLACPVCKADVEPVETTPGKSGLRCAQCRKIYPIRDGIPQMTVNEAVSA